ncbi:MAG: hypothetical protein GVY19_14135 [Bacteroidetes bacterium]|jgi:hypothetical protein|nr:hypothetical protein [Bacteroidota bacterium]
MKTIMHTLLFIPLFMHVSSSCAQDAVNRKLPDFTAIDAKGSVDVFLTKGEETSVRLEFRNIPENEIITEVDGNTLRIYIDSNLKIFQNNDVKAYVTFKNLEAIYASGSGNVTSNSKLEGDNINISCTGSGDICIHEPIAGDEIEIQSKGSGELQFTAAMADEISVSTHGSGDLNINGLIAADELALETRGSGDIRAENVKVDYLKTSIAGSGDIRVNAGNCDQIEVDVRGSGDLYAHDFMSQQAKIDIAGSGDVTLGVEQDMAVSIRGSGDIKYKGKGKISRVDIKGSGSVNKI